MARLFIAIELPNAISDDLAAANVPSHALTWVPRDQLHLTLRFLGEWPTERLDDLVRAIREVRVEPFLLSLKGCGTFPPDATAQVFWIGIGSGHPRLHQLRKRIDDALLNLAPDTDLRRFEPHVTLARLRPRHAPTAFKPLAHTFASYESAPFRVTGFVLNSSVLKPLGAVHTTLSAVAF